MTTTCDPHEIMSARYGVGHQFESRDAVEQAMRDMFRGHGPVRFVDRGQITDVLPDGWIYPYAGWDATMPVARFRRVHR